MYRPKFGTNDQICFDTEPDYYEFLGYIAKDDGTTKIVWEHNDEQGAWGAEGRIQFYGMPPGALRAKLEHTAGAGSITSRVNCNAFIKHIKEYHNFVSNCPQNIANIRTSIPAPHLSDFDRGLAL